MNNHVKIISRSILSLVATLAIGGGITYALFNSNTVTISGNSMAGGEAAIKLCNATGANNWRNTISPSLSVSDLVPSATDTKQLTADNQIYLGNDGGSLDALLDPSCDTYFDTASSSDVAMAIVPTLNTVRCPDDPNLATQMKLKFDFNDGTVVTSEKSLTDWTSNSTGWGSLAPDEVYEVNIIGRLGTGATTQNGTCTFDINFAGEQA